MFSVHGLFLVLIWGIVLKLEGIYARPSSDDFQSCPSTGIPQGSQRGVNVRPDNKPVYKLSIPGLKKSGYKPGSQYEVTVLAQDPNKRFGDVMLWLQDEPSRCGPGILENTPGQFLQPDNCPKMVFKDTKPVEYQFSFKWTAPACGCVIIRARVESAKESVFFMEDEDVIDGHLTKRACPQDDSITLNLMSKKEKHKLLCELTQSARADDIAHRSYVQARRKVDFSVMPLLEQEAWVMSFDQKIFEVQQCCKMVPSEQDECLADVRRHRIDRYCVYGESIVPFTAKRRDFMLKMEQECCWRLGEGRYQCFSSGPSMDGSGRHVDALENMDESDPVNDLEDFRTEIGHKILESNLSDQKMETIEKVKETKKPVDSEEDEDDDDDSDEKNDDNDEENDDKNEDLVTVTEAPLIITTKEKKFEAGNIDQRQIEGVSNMENALDTTKERKEYVSLKERSSNVESTTAMSSVLKKKLERTRTKLECCDLGNQYGALYHSGDVWNRCENEAHSTAKTYRTGKRLCKNYFLRCCIEQIQRRDDVNLIRLARNLEKRLSKLKFVLNAIVTSKGFIKASYQLKANDIMNKIKIVANEIQTRSTFNGFGQIMNSLTRPIKFHFASRLRTIARKSSLT